MGEYGEVVDFVVGKAKRGESLTIAPLSLHPPILAKFDNNYQKVLNGFDLALPDSFWILWGINFLHNRGYKKRFYGPYFMRDVAKKAKREGLNIYLFGGKEKKSLDKLKRRFEKFKGKGRVYAYKASFSIDEAEIEELAAKVKRKGKGILFIGVGTPLQHRLTKKINQKLDMPIAGVGAAFGLLSGEEEMAPNSWRENGIEWLFRLKKDPTRLMGRYLLCLLFFPFIFFEKLKKTI